jgi:hypothetical protein|tara:strand:- start:13443 stop:13655 length:213 start_codon:yes stop_codon:yes gene_type:complete
MDTDRMTVTPEEGAKVMVMAGKFKAYAPHFEGFATPESAVKDMLKVIENASLENGDGGAFVSQFGNKQWL